MEVTIDSLEDMCALMCDNVIKKADCTECPYAIWDYETYYNTTQKQYFVSGCRKDKSPEECEEEDD